MTRRLSLAMTLCALLAADASGDSTGFPAVSFTTSGSPGAWTLDFSVTNNIGGTNDIYFFGVLVPDSSISASPAGWEPFTGFGGTFPIFDGTTSITYNDVWISSSIPVTTNAVAPDSTLGGFDVAIADQAVPPEIFWFAAALGGVYTGPLNVNDDPTNPVFQGFTTGNGSGPGVPEPRSLALMGVGLAVGLAGRRWASGVRR